MSYNEPYSRKIEYCARIIPTARVTRRKRSNEQRMSEQSGRFRPRLDKSRSQSLIRAPKSMHAPNAAVRHYVSLRSTRLLLLISRLHFCYFTGMSDAQSRGTHTNPAR